MYHKKLSPQEALNEIKLRMKYDSRKTLTENLLLEQTEDEKIASEIWSAAYAGGIGTWEKTLRDAIKKIKNPTQFWSVNSALKTKSKLDIPETINDEYDYNDYDVVKEISDYLNSIGIKCEFSEKSTSGGTKRFGGNFKITSAPTAATATATTTTPVKDEGSGVGTGVAGGATKVQGNTPPQNSKGGSSVTIPDDLGGVEGVKAFQDWLDQNKGKWAYSTRSKTNYSVNQNPKRGYGNYGSNTQKMWNDPKVKEEYLNSKGQKDKTFAPGVVDDENASTTEAP